MDEIEREREREFRKKMFAEHEAYQKMVRGWWDAPLLSPAEKCAIVFLCSMAAMIIIVWPLLLLLLKEQK